MPLSKFLIHVVPIQVTVSGSTAIITCADERAEIVNGEIVFTLDDTGLVHQRIRFVTEDPPDTSTHDNYLHMASAPPLERLVAWKRSGNVSRSPEMTPGHDFEVVAVAFSVPQKGSDPNTPVDIGHGRRRFKIRGTGAPGGNIF